ncbi:MAG: ABC transporter permease [Clostridiales Family XIII bacterium]|jgi:ABC-2 type transport system permease protein|nr:ABC transporter permease [Clostridiales Family XIII bacterium]
MNNILTIFRNGLRNSKGVLMMSLALSVVITAMFVLIIGVAESSVDDINIGVIDGDSSFVSDDFEAYLSEDIGAKVVRSDDIEYLNTELLEKNISAVIEIPKGFEEGVLSGSPVPLELTFLDDYANEAFVRSYIDSYSESVLTLALATGGDRAKLETLVSEAASVVPDIETVTKDAGQLRREAERSGMDTMLGFFMMFAFIIAIGLANALYFDRTNGTFRRIKSANATAVQYTVAMSLVGLVMALLTVILPLAYLGVRGIDTGVPLLVIVLMVVSYAVFVVGFGMLVGLTMPSFNSMLFCLIAVGQVMAMIGGAYFPIEYSPEIFQKIALITPQYWFFEAIHSYQDGAGNFSFFLPLGIISLMSLLCFVLTAVRFASSRSAGRPLAA